MKTALHTENGMKKTVYAPNHKPEDFFTDVIKFPMYDTGKRDIPEGYHFLWDRRKSGDNFQRFGKPTELTLEVSRNYPLGASFSSWEVIPWKDGRVLILIKNQTEGFLFSIWAGLKVKEV
jgi:hypothetical protein